MNKKEASQTTSNSKQEPLSHSNDVINSVTARTNWGQRVLSPWVQRTLSTASKVNSRQSRVTLTGTYTSALLNRLQRMEDERVVRSPAIGASRPETVDRFTDTIVNRFTQTKAQPPIVQRAVAETDLTLAGAAEATTAPEETAETEPPPLPFSLDEVRQAVDKWRYGGSTSTPTSSPSPSPPSAPPVQRQPDPPVQSSSRLPTMAEVRAALEKPHFAKSSASTGQQTSAAPVQRTPGGQQPGKPTHIPPRRRLRSRIEEVTPDKLSAPPTPPEPLPPSAPPPPPSPPVQPRREEAPSAPSSQPSQPPPQTLADDALASDTARPQDKEEPPAPPIQRQPSPAQPPPQRPAPSDPPKSPPVQRQATPSAPKKAPPSRPTAQRQPEGRAKPPAPSQPPIQSDEPPTPLTPERAAADDEPVTVTGQRQPDVPEPSSTPTEEESSERPPVVEAPLLAADEDEETTAETSTASGASPVQRQPETDLPLPPTPLTPGSKPPSAKTSEADTPSSGSAISEPSRSPSSQQIDLPGGVTKTEPPVQRQPDGSETSETDAALAAGREAAVTDTAAVEKSGDGDEVAAEPPATTPLETADEVSDPPAALQRQATDDLPLRKRGVPNQPPQTTADSQPPVAAEQETAKPKQPTAPVQRQREETPVAEPASPVDSEPDFGTSAAADKPIAQRQSPGQRHLDETEVPEFDAAAGNEEAITDTTTVEKSGGSDEVAAEPPAVTSFETDGEVSGPPAAVQHQAERDLPLRKQALPNQLHTSGQRQQETASVEESPEIETPAVAETPVQRHLDQLEIPESEAAVGIEETATDTSAAEISGSRDAPVEAAAKRRGVPETVQRETESDLPLRQQTPPKQPPKAPADSQPAGDAEKGVTKQEQPTTSIQRRSDETPAAALPATPGGEPDFDGETALPVAEDDQVDLNKNILTKAEAGARLPLAKLPAAARQNIVQPKRAARGGVLPQAREDKATEAVVGGETVASQPVRPPSAPPSSGSSAPAVSQRAELPLARPARIEVVEAPTPAKSAPSSASPFSTVQRQMAETGPVTSGATTSTGNDTVQREPEAETTTTTPSSTTSPAQASAVDLDKLARQVYPEIKRLLARERDRLGR